MKILLIPILLGVGLFSSWLMATEQYPINHHNCGTGVSLVITGEDRFDPMVQQLLLKQQMSGHRLVDKPRFLVIPYDGEAELTEVQIRYLEMLLSKAAKSTR
ncbi:hypothetical protein DV711_02895 [Motiliproteus coralliicola]|uniref:Uncharacterized protein n=1 Tax=Motiliproteus coralliicola TaxID=2283196 RepID=A0A369WS94_9GAMM|nr:hypothetical protein [Motiliproteus coralliicola]RDE24552.1 hypothetical protein DV711_02895 [Motiliproteus coralliicola]